MKPKRLILTILIVGCGLLLAAGCEEETAKPPQQLSPEWFKQFDHLQQPASGQSAIAGTDSRGAPKIAFETVVHDFGDVGPTTNSLCEFRFTNAGTGILRIEDVVKTCGCTPFQLEKKDYAPGESGTLKVQYYSDNQVGPVTKNLIVRTNDSTQPQIELVIRAQIITKVDLEPKALSLMLKGENAGCPKITLSSVDNQPFSITYFRSTANCVTAGFDPSAVANSFVLEPQVDMAKLAKTMNGNIEIGLTHPECKTVTLSLSTLPRFRITPGAISIRGAAPNVPVVRKVAIANNYNEDFELESTWSKGGAVKVLSNTKTQDGYELELQITPPATDKRGVMTETLFVRTKGGDQVSIPLTAFYTGVRAPSAAAVPAEDPEKCKTCGPKIIDPTTGTLTTHIAQE
ncbi:MAG: DUF1573 domain-containing protein [Planctomycetota bacterium]